MLPPFWINNIDKNGRVIDEQFIRLAKHMWPQAVTATGKMLRDTSRTAEIMEVAVHSVWAVCLRGGVEALEKKENYLRKTFFRLLRRIAAREEAIVYKPPSILQIDLETTRDRVQSDDLWSPLELDDLLERLSRKERELIILHCLQGHDWKYISRLTGIPVGSARVQHFNAMRKLERMAEEAGGSKKKK